MHDTRHPAARNLPLCRAVNLSHLVEALPPDSIAEALAAAGRVTRRIKRLDLDATVILVIAMHLDSRKRLGEILRDLCHPARIQQAVTTAAPVAGDAAIWYRRQQVGVAPLVALFRSCAHPLATPQTRGAWLGACRLVALDGTTLALPNTPANRRAFGGPSNQYGDTAAPHLRALLLVECGTHAILDAGCWPYATSEHPCARRLVRSVTPDMLVLGDRGLYSYELLSQLRARGAHFLFRLPANVQVVRRRRLPDGSWLAEITAPDRGGRRHQPPLQVRLIEYRIEDPQADPAGYRLVTDLLDVATYPATTLALTYHERWEVEQTIDEVKTHLDLAQRPLRSHCPLGVIQEFYGLLIAHLLVRTLMHLSALEGDVDPDRLSFTHAVQVLDRYRPDCQRATGADRARLLTWIRYELREDLLPPRRDRVNPRAVNQRRSRFPPKKPDAGSRRRRPIAELLQLI